LSEKISIIIQLTFFCFLNSLNKELWGKNMLECRTAIIKNALCQKLMTADRQKQTKKHFFKKAA
jgi:hypothetical protein